MERPKPKAGAAGATIARDGGRPWFGVFVTQESRPRRALLVGSDLMGRARLEQPLADAGYSLATASPERLDEALRAEHPTVVILDLDSGGRSLLDRLVDARNRGAVTGRVVGYFSHVDAELGDAAREAGCTAFPRGRFWRSLPEVLSGS